jgi:hypothetical protein
MSNNLDHVILVEEEDIKSYLIKWSAWIVLLLFLLFVLYYIYKKAFSYVDLEDTLNNDVHSPIEGMLDIQYNTLDRHM